MIYEIQVQFTKIDKNGNDKVAKEKYIVENAASFGDAEEMGYSHCEGETGLDVIAVKRSPIKEIVNRRTNDNEKIFLATIIDYFYVEGKEEPVENKYILALHAEDINKAHAIVREHLKQGLDDMELVALKCTKYLEVL
jgi:hypothetical protein